MFAIHGGTHIGFSLKISHFEAVSKSKKVDFYPMANTLFETVSQKNMITRIAIFSVEKYMEYTFVLKYYLFLCHE